MRTRWVAVRNDFSTPVDRVFTFLGVMRFAPLPAHRPRLEYRTRVATPLKGALRRNVTNGLARVDART